MKEKAAWGLVKRTQIYLPTWKGWLALLAVAGLFVSIGIHTAYPFLALNEPVRQEGPVDLLVLEGWAPKNVVEAAANLYHEGHHAGMATTGGPVTGNNHLVPFATYALFGSSRLQDLGVPEDRIFVTPPHPMQSRRTLYDILALRDALAKQGPLPKTINVVTADIHARRTRMHFQRIFGKDTKIGIIGVAPDDYDPEHWWRTSYGAKHIIMELMSTCYETLWPARLGDDLG